MNNSPILLFDSGIGGLSVLKEMTYALPHERYLYLGDNNNAPYGNKSTDELTFLTYKNCDIIKKYKPKAVVLACNTLSVDFLDFVKEKTGVKTFGVFPPVSKALREGKSSILLATERTCSKYKGEGGLYLLPLTDLAREIEKNAFNLSAIDLNKQLCRKDSGISAIKGYFDTVILGCTHYNFLKTEISNHFCPRKVLSGGTFAVKNVKKYLEKNELLGNYRRFSVSFIGDTAEFNKKFYYSVVKKM